MKLHFISGLPRSGSTLLAALLRQNPNFHAAMSTPLAQLVMRLQHAMSAGSEGSVFIADDQRRRLLRGLVANYYAGSAAGHFRELAVQQFDYQKKSDQVIFDTNRAWCAKMSLIVELFPDAKVICCVRDVQWIMESVEKLIQDNPLGLSGLFGYQANSTVFSRVSALAAPEGLVGYALNALREAYWGPFADRLILLDYEALAKEPREALNHLYKFLGEEPFAHDFENFEYDAQEFDGPMGTPGLHRVRGPVRWEEPKRSLPPDLFHRFVNDAFWRDPTHMSGASVVMFTRPQQKLRAMEG